MFPHYDTLQSADSIPIKAEESREQARLVAGLRRHWSKFPEDSRPMVFSVPMGGSRNPVEGANLKIKGALAGVSDLIILLPRGETIFVEMKAENGVLSKGQQEFLKRTTNLGYSSIVAYSAEDALQQLKEIF